MNYIFTDLTSQVIALPVECVFSHFYIYMLCKLHVFYDMLTCVSKLLKSSCMNY